MGLYQSIQTLFRKDKPKWASLCSLSYTDKKGLRYYKHNDMLDMCVYRKGEIDKCLLELRYSSSYSDVLNALKDSLNEHDKRGNMKPDLIKIGYLINELYDRDDMLLLSDILFKVCANTLIREDENPYIVDQEILEEKVNVFKAEIQRGGLHTFFQSVDLLRLIGLSTISPVELTRYMIDSETKQSVKIRQFKALISDNLSARGLLKEESTLSMNLG